MSSSTIAFIALVCIFGSAVFALYLRDSAPPVSMTYSAIQVAELQIHERT
jgi:hypothetical protein